MNVWKILSEAAEGLGHVSAFVPTKEGVDMEEIAQRAHAYSMDDRIDYGAVFVTDDGLFLRGEKDAILELLGDFGLDESDLRWEGADGVKEAAPPPIPPRRSVTTPIGAGVTSKVSGATGQPIELTVGKQRFSFSPDEFVEMIKDGSLSRMVQSGQVRRLPGVG